MKKVKTLEGHELLFLLPTNNDARTYIYKKLYDNDFQKEILVSFGKEIP